MQPILLIETYTNNRNLYEYRSLGKHSRLIFSNFSLFASTISQGRLSLKDCYYFTGFKIDFKKILKLSSLNSAKIPWGDMLTLKPIASHLNILYLRPIVNYKYYKVPL